MIRKSAVAGSFYPGNKKKLEDAISLLFKNAGSKKKNQVKALILPHAGYQYSGAVAAQTVSQAELKDTFIILGPNHTGIGKPFSVMAEGSWQTPLGEIQIDSELAQAILKESKYLESDAEAHASEHSIEVLIPFLQFALDKVSFVPIIISRADKNIYETIAGDIVRAIKSLGRENDVLLIASSDMTHFESRESAQKKDHYAIEAITQLNTDDFLRRIDKEQISMCGVAPVAIILEAVKALGAKEGQLVCYQTSGEATGDYDSVVGYAGIRIN